MRKVIAIAGALALTAALAVPAVATKAPADAAYPEDGYKVLVCRATSSEGKWVEIVVDVASASGAKRLTAHRAHEDETNKKFEQADWIVDTEDE